MGKTILHVMGMDSTKYGGLEKYNVELARQLLLKGYKSVFVYEDYPCVKEYTDDLTSLNAQIIVINSRKNIHNFCVSFWNLLKQYDFSIIHAHFTKARFYAIPIALIYGLKSVYYTLHSCIDSIENIKLHTRLWYYVMNKYCKVVTVSRHIEDSAKYNWRKIQSKTLYLGVNDIVREKIDYKRLLNIPQDKLALICVANFNHIKGLDILIYAMKNLIDTMYIRNIKLYILGQPEKEKNELAQLIDDLKITDYIQLEGIKNNVSQYLLASDIFILPSRSEGISLALMEACAAGLPIIASNVGGIPEVAKENVNSILFESENTQELGECMTRLINNRDLRVKFGEQSKKIFNKYFSIETNVGKLIKYYNLD